MHVFFIKFFEGNNIKGNTSVVKISAKCENKDEIDSFVQKYLEVFKALDYDERVISIDNEGEYYDIWLTYKREDMCEYIINCIVHDSIRLKNPSDKIEKLFYKNLSVEIADKARKHKIPIIEHADGVYQLGYGVKSIVLSNQYQSYENTFEVIRSKNRKDIYSLLRYNNIPRVETEMLYHVDEKKCIQSYPISICNNFKEYSIDISCKNSEELLVAANNIINSYGNAIIYTGELNYKIICYKGKSIIVFKRNKHGNYEKIEELDRFFSLTNKVYKVFKIEFMYIDIYEDLQSLNQLKVKDLGCVFNIENELFNIREDVVDFFIENIKKHIGSIPIISITGSNGKTTTARLIYHIFNRLGYVTGLASTEGIFIGNSKIKEGDTTGFLSAREVLTNNDVEVCVLETARGGIAKNGLGYVGGRVGIITSISEDHVGMEGTENLEKLIDVKSIIIKELEKGGKAILKAQNELNDVISLRTDIEVCLYNLEKNEIIERHVKHGGEAFYLKDGYIMHCMDYKENIIADINTIEFTHFGKSRSNALNVIASLAAVYHVHKNLGKIINIISSLQCDLYINPGRQNIINMGKYKIILDYGHNGEAFTEIFNLAKKYNPSKITSIIAAPGDRMDQYIRELGEIAAEYSDDIVIREQEDLRGREQEESAVLIKEGVLSKKFNMDNLKVILKEEDAIVYAMDKAIEGEIIILFTQCLDLILRTINKHIESEGVLLS